MTTLCVTTFNRQDLLGACLRSACSGTVAPDRVVIIDQSGQSELLARALSYASLPVIYEVVDLHEKRGCEASAINYYLLQTCEERIITHDDVVFGPRTIELFLSTPGAFLIDTEMGVLTYRDACREKAGLYDPDISPNYFRFVDVDYEDRLALVNIHPVVIDAGVQHLRDGTTRGATPKQMEDYYRRFAIAERNYVNKWHRGLTPGGNTIGRAAWRKAQVVAA